MSQCQVRGSNCCYCQSHNSRDHLVSCFPFLVAGEYSGMSSSSAACSRAAAVIRSWYTPLLLVDDKNLRDLNRGSSTEPRSSNSLSSLLKCFSSLPRIAVFISWTRSGSVSFGKRCFFSSATRMGCTNDMVTFFSPETITVASIIGTKTDAICSRFGILLAVKTSSRCDPVVTEHALHCKQQLNSNPNSITQSQNYY